MRILTRLFLVLLVVFAAGAALYTPVVDYFRTLNQIQYRTESVSQGDITWVVDSTGTIKPVEEVNVGTFVSGPIKTLNADFNSRVKEGDILAEIDPLIYDANVARDRAVLATREADVNRVKAQLSLAQRDLDRARALRAENRDYVSQAELDQFHFNNASLAAQLAVAKASVDQAKASLDNSEAQLGYTIIKAPVDGIVTNVKVRSGQTVAAQFQTPELFVIAPDMETKMHVHASVDEADIGLIRDAKERQQPVRFTVDAYPDDLFTGEIEQVRLSATTLQSVVTYPVIVGAPNAELKLLPNMTASLSFQIESKSGVMRIPNSALRFYPDINQVHPDDRHILEGTAIDPSRQDNADEKQSAIEKAEAGRMRHQRHVWVQDGQFLRAVPVTTGINDNKYTELVSGDLKLDQPLVIGIQTTPTP